MHFVGKILVVLLVVLSVLFMAFTGVVYNTQGRWRTAFLKEKDNVAKAVKERDDTRADYDRFKTDMEQKVKLANNNAENVDATRPRSWTRISKRRPSSKTWRTASRLTWQRRNRRIKSCWSGTRT
jgi:hypothetical protein